MSVFYKGEKAVKELKEKGQQVISLPRIALTESLSADKVYYLLINEASLCLIQTIDQVS